MNKEIIPGRKSEFDVVLYKLQPLLMTWLARQGISRADVSQSR